MRSRSIDSLRGEAEELARVGVRELVLIAQDTTDYGRDLGEGADLPRLLRRLSGVEGIEWIRVHYAYPNRITRELLTTMAEIPKICRYLDIPLQHSDARILRAMKRGGSGEIFRQMMGEIRSILPDCALRTTFIVGFPGETEEAFEHLARFVEEIRFDHLGVFPYSHEEGTAAYALHDDVPAPEKQERRGRLMELQSAIALEKNRGLVGKTLPVRVDGTEDDTRMLLVGRTEHQAPDVDSRILIVDGEADPGMIVPVRIEKAHPYDLVGRILPASENSAAS